MRVFLLLAATCTFGAQLRAKRSFNSTPTAAWEQATEADDESVEAQLAAAEVQAATPTPPESYILPTAVRSDFQEGFQGAVAPQPNLVAQIRPTMGNIQYEESLLREAARNATELTLMIEQVQLEAALRKEAMDQAQKASAARTKQNSETVAVRAFHVTRRMLQRKAVKTCKAISNMPTLPKLCAEEAGTEFDKVLNTATTSWAPNAVAALKDSTAQEAARVAFEAVQEVPTVVIHPVAYQGSRKVFQEMWPKLERGFEELTKQETADLQQAKVDFWANAEKDLTAKVQSAVKAAIWDKPVKHANEVIAKTAKATANKATSKGVAEHLAPLFQEAAKIALTKSIRSANAKVMQTWKSDWDLLDGSTNHIKRA
mmetsp:Transcript_11604/g.25786  ORF Transcript_11604/g.25786 Transcript_11604/m.25786 type:complete len:372 (-) Transcript_11604:196-1311(-)